MGLKLANIAACAFDKQEVTIILGISFMKGLKPVFWAFFLCYFVVCKANSTPQKIDRGAFYAALQSNNLEKVNSEIVALQTLPGNLNAAYVGALQIKKSGLISGSSEKLSLFKSGRDQLEKAIGHDSSNVELRFVRLEVQEHTPKGLGYKDHLVADASYVESHFKKVDRDLKKEIIEYSKTSMFIKISSLNE